MRAQERFEPGGGGGTRSRVAHAEGRVAVLAAYTFADKLYRLRQVQLWMEGRAPAVSEAMYRPDASVFREVGRDRRMPILGQNDCRSARLCSADFPVDDRHHPLAAGHVEAPGRIGEVVLNIDDEKGSRGIVRQTH